LEKWRAAGGHLPGFAEQAPTAAAVDRQTTAERRYGRLTSPSSWLIIGGRVQTRGVFASMTHLNGVQVAADLPVWRARNFATPL